MKKVKVIKIKDYPLVGGRKMKQRRSKRAFDIVERTVTTKIYRVSAYDKNDAAKRYSKNEADLLDDETERIIEIRDCS